MWHPSTLLPKQCYQDYSKTFSSRMLNFAKQTQEIHSTLNAVMKVPPTLNTVFPARFYWYKAKISPPLAASDHGAGRLCISEFCLLSRRLDIIFHAHVFLEVPSILSFSSLCPRCFVALTRVDSIRCEDKTSSLITVVKPGKRLGVYHFTGKLQC